MLDLSTTLASDAFAQRARHPDFPTAFTRRRSLPLPALVAALLSAKASSQQIMLDAFYGALGGEASLRRGVSDRAFAKARSHLHAPALAGLNDALVARADGAGLVPRWQGLRLVAGDASVLRPAIRACRRTRGLAQADQRLFALYLPGAELTLHAAVHAAAESERAMLVEALDKLGPDDVLLLDRGYPAAWLVNLLTTRGVRFVMRCDTTASTWAALHAFMRGDAPEAQVQLSPPKAQDVRDWGCSAQAPGVRLVRHVAPNGQVRVLMTNLSSTQAPAAAYGDLYHRRWRIEEAFKRLKHRLHIEAVSGLSQQALLVDVAAKTLADNLAALLCAAAQPAPHAPTTPPRLCQRAYAAQLLPRWLPRVLMATGNVLALSQQALSLLARSARRHPPDRSAPRHSHRVKPHPHLAYKG